MPPDIYVVGTGGLAKEVARVISQINETSRLWRFAGYVASDRSEIGKTMPFGSVANDDQTILALGHPIALALGIGYPAIRKKVAEKFSAMAGVLFPNLIHPRADVDPKLVSFGKGNVITSGCVFTCDIHVGDFNYFNLNTTVGHDCRIGSHNVVNPGCNISGGGTIGNEILLGTGSQVLEGLSIASRTIIGAGAVVVKDIEEEGNTYVGIPAKRRA